MLRVVWETYLAPYRCKIVHADTVSRCMQLHRAEEDKIKLRLQTRVQPMINVLNETYVMK